jgi:hypothetical protein
MGVLGFKVESRERVDEIYADLTAAGYRGQQPPYDAFWGARYAVIEDPDGNAVGIMSPVDPDRRSPTDFGEMCPGVPADGPSEDAISPTLSRQQPCQRTQAPGAERRIRRARANGPRPAATIMASETSPCSPSYPAADAHSCSN